MVGLTTNLKLQSVFVGKSDLDTGITRSFKVIGDALGISLPVRTEGIEALKASYVAGIKRIEAKLDVRLPIDVNGMYGFQANVAANFRRIDAVIGAGGETPTITNTRSNSTLLPSQVADASALFAARQQQLDALRNAA